jgi:hypothetical protein
MNKSDRVKVLNTAKAIMSMYLSLKEVLKDDHWAMATKSQGYRDSLEAMKRNDLILGYNLASGEITPKALT